MLGLTLAPLDDDMRSRLGLEPSAEGLMIMAVDQASEAFTKGLTEGDLITEAGQQKVVRLQDLEDRIKEAKDAGRKSILLLVRRGGDPRFVALSIQD
jgi:serine protease Do